jgi:hypothetical protein
MSNTITSLSLGDAATATGMNKSSILRAIKSGRISATRDEVGQWRIEPGELFRVYPAVAPGDAPQRYALAMDTMVAAMREQTMDVLVANLRDQIADMRGQRDEELDAWRDQAQRLALPKPEPKPKPKPWWKRLRLTG